MTLEPVLEQDPVQGCSGQDWYTTGNLRLSRITLEAHTRLSRIISHQAEARGGASAFAGGGDSIRLKGEGEARHSPQGMPSMMSAVPLTPSGAEALRRGHPLRPPPLTCGGSWRHERARAPRAPMGPRVPRVPMAPRAPMGPGLSACSLEMGPPATESEAWRGQERGTPRLPPLRRRRLGAGTCAHRGTCLSSHGVNLGLWGPPVSSTHQADQENRPLAPAPFPCPSPSLAVLRNARASTLILNSCTSHHCQSRATDPLAPPLPPKRCPRALLRAPPGPGETWTAREDGLDVPRRGVPVPGSGC